MKIVVLGLGNFGYAMLKHLDNISEEKGFELWGFDRKPDLIQHFKENKRHSYLHTGVEIGHNISFCENVQTVVQDADYIVFAVNSDATREILSKIQGNIKENVVFVQTAKALDYQTGKRFSTIFQEFLPNEQYYYSILAGGTIAQDLFQHEPLGVDIASESEEILPNLVSIFQSKNLNVYPSTDLVGVEYASAFKNVIAILAGIINGMGFSYGSQTHIISRAAYEIEKIILRNFTASSQTFQMNSQSWGNDLWMSCTGNSRNRAFGITLGTGVDIDTALEMNIAQKKTVEGVRTIQALDKIPAINNYPLTQFLYDFIVSRQAKLEDLRKIVMSNVF